MSQLLGLSISVGICIALFALVFLWNHWKARRGGADGIRQLIALDHDRLFSLEYVHLSGDDGGVNEERWSVRSLTDGRLLARRALDGELHIVARGPGHLVAVGTRPRVCVLDATPAVVAGEAEIKAATPALDELAAPDALSPEVRDGRLSVLTAQGRRVTLALAAVGDRLAAVSNQRPTFDPRAERRSGMRLGEGPRRQLALRGKAVAGVDFLDGAFLVEPEAPEVLIVHKPSLDGEGGLISALDRDGRPRWTASLDRSLDHDAEAVVVAGDKLVCALTSRHPRPAELFCLDLRNGAVLWRLRP